MSASEAQDIVQNFISAIRNFVNPKSALEISPYETCILTIESPDRRASGKDWTDKEHFESNFDFIILDLPIGLQREKTDISGFSLTIPKNWIETFKGLTHLKDGGSCIALIEPSAFSVFGGSKFLSALKKSGYHLNGLFNAPKGTIETSAIRPVLAIFSKTPSGSLFVADLEDRNQALAVANSFIEKTQGGSLSEGLFINEDEFNGFEGLKAKIELEKLDTQYKEYKTKFLEDISLEINTVRSGETYNEKNNCVYIPVIGASPVTKTISEINIKHHNVIQVVLDQEVFSDYIVIFFESHVGRLALQSLTKGAVIGRINKSSLGKALIAVPNQEEQRNIIYAHRKLSTLSGAITELKSELSLNPRSAPIISEQAEEMLDRVNRLSDAERVTGLARQGESRTIEFKQTLSMDVSTGDKKKEIEIAALKTIVAFLNTAGGILLVGVDDSGNITGIDEEIQKHHKNSCDKFLLFLKNKIRDRIGEQYYPFITQNVVNVNGARVLTVECDGASIPCYLDGKDFFVRTNPATDKLEGPKLVEYVRMHFSLY